MKPLQNLLLFQYLVIVLEGDFLPRNATMNWSLQRESLLNMLLGSRKINYKSLMKDCVEVICQLCQLLQNELSKYLEFQESSESQLSKNCYTALSLALLEVLKNTRVYMEKLLVMIMALDMSRKKAEIEGHTSRVDSPRTPLVDIILDGLAYSKDNVPHFLKAQLSILSEGNTGDKEGASALVDLCQMFISSFDSLRSTDWDMEILSIGKETLFTATTIISMKS